MIPLVPVPAAINPSGVTGPGTVSTPHKSTGEFAVSADDAVPEFLAAFIAAFPVAEPPAAELSPNGSVSGPTDSNTLPQLVFPVTTPSGLPGDGSPIPTGPVPAPQPLPADLLGNLSVPESKTDVPLTSAVNQSPTPPQEHYSLPTAGEPIAVEIPATDPSVLPTAGEAAATVPAPVSPSVTNETPIAAPSHQTVPAVFDTSEPNERRGMSVPRDSRAIGTSAPIPAKTDQTASQTIEPRSDSPGIPPIPGSNGSPIAPPVETVVPPVETAVVEPTAKPSEPGTVSVPVAGIVPDGSFGSPPVSAIGREAAVTGSPPVPVTDPGQLAEAIASRTTTESAHGRYRMSFQVETWGQVRVEMMSRSDGMTARIEIQVTPPQSVLSEQLAPLREGLIQHGIRVDSIDIRSGASGSSDHSDGSPSFGQGQSGGASHSGGRSSSDSRESFDWVPDHTETPDEPVPNSESKPVRTARLDLSA